MRTKYFFIGFISGIFLVSFVLGSYMVGKITSGGQSQPQNSASNTTSSTPSPIPLVEVLSKTDVYAKIENTVKLRNYESLDTLMAEKVAVRIEGTECCQESSAAAAIKNLEYLKGGELWSFDQTSKVAKDLSATYPENYGGAFIGISKNGYVVGFQLDKMNKIEKISIAASFKY